MQARSADRTEHLESTDIYQLLGVGPKASERDVRRAYKRLLQQHHPDRSTDPEAEERFKSIQAAYAAFKSRLALEEDRSAKRLARSEFDREVRVQVSVEQAFEGGEIDIRLSPPSAPPEELDNPALVRVRIPPGVQHGEQLRVRNVLGNRRGDLYITIEIKKDRRFRVIGSDLVYKLKIAPWEAVLGGIIDVPTLEGSVQVAIKSGSTAGQRLRLQGRGLQHPSGGRGDLYCILEIVVPEKVGELERDLYRKLAENSKFNARATQDPFHTATNTTK